MKTTELPLCGYTLLRTEHPKLFILEAKPGNTFANRGIIPVNNLDIFTYMNSKFVYCHVLTHLTLCFLGTDLRDLPLQASEVSLPIYISGQPAIPRDAERLWIYGSFF